MHEDNPRIWISVKESVKSEQVEGHLQQPSLSNALVLQMLEETLMELVCVLHFLVVVCIQPLAIRWHVEFGANRIAPSAVLKDDEILFRKLSTLSMNAYPLF